MLSRFWYLVIALLGATALGAALLSQTVINTRSDENLEDSLRRDRIEFKAFTRLEARARLDGIAFITVDSTVGNLLRRASGLDDDKKLRELSAELKEALRGHITRLAEATPGDDSLEEKRKRVEPDIAFALDSSGRIIAQLGPLEANPPGASLATFPLVKRALQGYVRDDVWVYDRRVYRMAARPVMSGTEYAGAILHGYRFDNDFARTMSENLGNATVVLFHGSDVLASHVPGEPNMPQRAEIAAALPAVLADAKFKEGSPTDTMQLQGGGHAVFAPIVGSAAVSQVGYAIARPRALLTSPKQLFDMASEDDVKALPIPSLGGGALLLAVLGILFLYVERDRHLRSLQRKTLDIASGDSDRLIVSSWRGGYRRLADAINQAIEKEVEKAAVSGPGRKKANLDEILGPTPTASAEPFFGFASEPDGVEPAAPAPAPAAPAKSPPPPVAKAKPPAPAAAPRASAPGAAPASSTTLSGDEEQKHWQQVYEQYVAMRKQHGEPTEGLTFDKFAGTLRKTRDQVMSKGGLREVRFAVYEKEGKAAIKAQPVKL